MSDIVKSIVQQKVDTNLAVDPHPSRGKSLKDQLMQTRTNFIQNKNRAQIMNNIAMSNRKKRR